jgi:hypothetical protein
MICTMDMDIQNGLEDFEQCLGQGRLKETCPLCAF